MVTVSYAPSLQVRVLRHDHRKRSDLRKRDQRPHPPKISRRGALPDPRGTGQFFFDPAKTNQIAGGGW